MTAKQIIEEEMSNLTETLTESFQLVGALESLQDSLYNKDGMVAEEHWNFFKDSLNAAQKQVEFQELSKLILLKLYGVKMFSKTKLIIAEDTENILKFELKKYISMLEVESVEGFIVGLSKLPFEFLAILMRYNANVLNKKMKSQLAPTLAEAEKYYAKLLEMRNDFYIMIDGITRGQENVFPIGDLQELLDTRAFFEDSALNVGCLEYILRLLNSKAKSKLQDEFGQEKIKLMVQQALVNPCYIKFLQDIKQDKVETFFTSDGLPNENRDPSFHTLVAQIFAPETYIPEPIGEEKPEEATAPAAEAPTEAQLNPEQEETPAGPAPTVAGQ